VAAAAKRQIQRSTDKKQLAVDLGNVDFEPEGLFMNGKEKGGGQEEEDGKPIAVIVTQNPDAKGHCLAGEKTQHCVGGKKKNGRNFQETRAGVNDNHQKKNGKAFRNS